MTCLDSTPVVVFDFETTGLSPDRGDRPIEIGAVRVEAGAITARFSQLMNPAMTIPRFVETLTGITNAMVADAAPVGEAISAFLEFAGDAPLVAHNASFDERFLRAETRRLKRLVAPQTCCTLLLARRLLPHCESHGLANLADALNLPMDGHYHRALADAEVTAHLWLHLMARLREQMPTAVLDFSLVRQVSATARHKLPAFFAAQT